MIPNDNNKFDLNGIPQHIQNNGNGNNNVPPHIKNPISNQLLQLDNDLTEVQKIVDYIDNFCKENKIENGKRKKLIAEIFEELPEITSGNKALISDMLKQSEQVYEQIGLRYDKAFEQVDSRFKDLVENINKRLDDRENAMEKRLKLFSNNFDKAIDTVKKDADRHNQERAKDIDRIHEKLGKESNRIQDNVDKQMANVNRTIEHKFTAQDIKIDSTKEDIKEIRQEQTSIKEKQTSIETNVAKIPHETTQGLKTEIIQIVGFFSVLIAFVVAIITNWHNVAQWFFGLF